MESFKKTKIRFLLVHFTQIHCSQIIHCIILWKAGTWIKLDFLRSVVHIKGPILTNTCFQIEKDIVTTIIEIWQMISSWSVSWNAILSLSRKTRAMGNQDTRNSLHYSMGLLHHYYKDMKYVLSRAVVHIYGEIVGNVCQWWANWTMSYRPMSKSEISWRRNNRKQKHISINLRLWLIALPID